MRKLISVIALVTLSVSVMFSQKDPAAKKILDALSAKYQSHTSFKANITYKLEVTSNPSLNESFKADVSMKGDKFYVSKTDGEKYYCDGKYIWNVVDGEAYVSDFNVEDNPINIDKVLTAYKSGYKYVKTGQETVGGVKCEIIDLNPDVTESEMATSDVFKIRLLVNTATNEVKQWIVFEKNGNRHNFKINSYKPNAQLSDTIFNYEYKKYPSISVEDLTENEDFSK